MVHGYGIRACMGTLLRKEGRKEGRSENLPWVVLRPGGVGNADR